MVGVVEAAALDGNCRPVALRKKSRERSARADNAGGESEKKSSHPQDTPHVWARQATQTFAVSSGYKSDEQDNRPRTGKSGIDCCQAVQQELPKRSRPKAG